MTTPGHDRSVLGRLHGRLLRRGRGAPRSRSGEACCRSRSRSAPSRRPAVLEELFQELPFAQGHLGDGRAARGRSCSRTRWRAACAPSGRATSSLTAASLETPRRRRRMLDGVIAAAASAGRAPVDRHAAWTQLEALAAAARPATRRGTAGTQRWLAVATPAARRSWKVTFVPSPALVARGVKVDTVRARLLQIGRVVERRAAGRAPAAASRSSSTSRPSDEQQLAAWRDDGADLRALAGGRPTGAAATLSTRPASRRTRRPHGLLRRRPTNFVRVDLARLDDLMRLVGDLVVTRPASRTRCSASSAHVPFQEWRALQEHSAGHRAPAARPARRRDARPAGAGRRDLPPHAVRRSRPRARQRQTRPARIGRPGRRKSTSS